VGSQSPPMHPTQHSPQAMFRNASVLALTCTLFFSLFAAQRRTRSLVFDYCMADVVPASFSPFFAVPTCNIFRECPKTAPPLNPSPFFFHPLPLRSESSVHKLFPSQRTRTSLSVLQAYGVFPPLLQRRSYRSCRERAAFPLLLPFL